VQYCTKTFEVSGRHVKLDCWDTAGQERFFSITKSYFRGTAAILLCFDVTRRETFTHLSRWLTEAKKLIPETCKILLVATKIDEQYLREVSFEEANVFAHDNDIFHFMETSAKTGKNVQEAFYYTVKSILEGVDNGSINAENMDSGVKKFHPLITQSSTTGILGTTTNGTGDDDSNFMQKYCSYC